MSTEPDGLPEDDGYPSPACGHARSCGHCGGRIMELEGQILGMTRYLGSIADLMEGHSQITGSIRTMSDMYNRAARSIEQQRLHALSADLAADPDPDDQGG